MGVEYSIACQDCKIQRDLDKFYSSISNVKNRQDALNYCEKIEKDSFRVGLLVSFLNDHIGHNVVFYNENFEESYGEYAKYKDDVDYWKEDK